MQFYLHFARNKCRISIDLLRYWMTLTGAPPLCLLVPNPAAFIYLIKVCIYVIEFLVPKKKICALDRI